MIFQASVFGATAACAISILANEKWAEAARSVLPVGESHLWEPSISGPIVEEPVKALGILLILLLALALRPPIHGFLIGAFVGLGFQIMENLVFAMSVAIAHPSSDLHGAVETMLVTSALGFGSHWFFSGLAGVGVAMLLQRNTRGLWFLLPAWLLHVIANSPVVSSQLMVAAVFFVVSLVAVLVPLK